MSDSALDSDSVVPLTITVRRQPLFSATGAGVSVESSTPADLLTALGSELADAVRSGRPVQLVFTGFQKDKTESVFRKSFERWAMRKEGIAIVNDSKECPVNG